MSARYARLVEIAKTARTSQEQATALGVTICALNGGEGAGEMSARYARLVEIAKTARTSQEQATALGVTICALKFIRHRAKAAGYDVGTVERERDRAPKLDRAAGGSSCPRCGLRGEHECISAERMASFRSAEYADLRRPS